MLSRGQVGYVHYRSRKAAIGLLAPRTDYEGYVSKSGEYSVCAVKAPVGPLHSTIRCAAIRIELDHARANHIRKLVFSVVLDKEPSFISIN
jgi:hypothetical protein